VALAPGTRLGPYEILSALGAGGMGEVYRARDTKLNRDVAIKVLPESVATDPDRLARFHREAQVLASLNHPNIAHIHGYEESNSVHALIMELVEGPTLADRIARGPIPLNEALPIAKQIAEGLEAAHEQGIIHRDLKPANIKVRDDGTVKVLDFGLAKALDPIGAAGSGVSQLPTITTPAMTQVGMVLGTASYMAPEQARGKPVDKRADVWAFGCVLFEMLTGRRAFAGDTVTDVFAAIVEREPQWNQLPDQTPEGIRRLLRRSVSKDVRARLHDMADARLEIDDAGMEPATTSVGGRQPSRRTRTSQVLALVAVTVAAIAATWLVARRERAAGADTPTLDATIDRLTNDSGVTRMPTLSFDGHLLAYSSDRAGNGDRDIWVQQVAGGNPLRLTDDPADDTTPDFSPDGSQVTFRSERNGGGVYMVSALGGAARLIAPGGRRPRFSPDGKQIAYWGDVSTRVGQFRGTDGRQSAVYVVSLSGGTPVRVLPDFQVVRDPVWLPDGGSLLVAGRRDQKSQLADSFDWWLARLDGTPPVKTGVSDVPLLRGTVVGPERWSRAGVIFSFKDDLWSIALSNAGRMSGQPRRLTLGVGPYVDPTVGPDDEIVFARLVVERVIERASLTNTSEPPARMYADTGSNTWRASETSDGSLIVFERTVGTAREIWTKNTHSGRQELVARVPTLDPLNATVSRDGARIAYTQGSAVTGGATGTGFVVETSGGVPRKICDACGLHGFLGDNQRVLVELNDGHAIRVIDVRTGVARDLVVASVDERVDRPHVSPDQRWLAFRSQRNAVGKSFVVRLTSDQPISMKGLEPIDEPTTSGRPAGWSLDSHSVYLLLDTDGFRCLWAQRIDPATGTLTGKPFAVRHFHSTNGMSTGFGNTFTADGFLYEAAEESANLWRLARARVGS
jgi:serine/threonine protein kinase/Tol biopolymer transport system component